MCKPNSLAEKSPHTFARRVTLSFIFAVLLSLSPVFPRVLTVSRGGKVYFDTDFKHSGESKQGVSQQNVNYRNEAAD